MQLTQDIEPGQAIPLPPAKVNDQHNEIVLFYGFPFANDAAFYRKVVDPSWVPTETIEGTEDPNLEVALNTLKQKTGFEDMTIATVISNETNNIEFMVAVASHYPPNKDSHKSGKVSQQQLTTIAAAAGLEPVKPRWLESSFDIEQLLEMEVPLL